MSNTLNRVDPQVGSGFGNKIRAVFDMTLSGSYPGSAGEVIDFTTPGANLVGSSQPPLAIDTVTFSGYVLEFVKGSALNNTALHIRQTGAALSSPLAELAAAAYPAALTAGPIRFTAEFTKF